MNANMSIEPSVDSETGRTKRGTAERRSGFTIIELLIVIAIIGIITAVMIPKLFAAGEKAKQKRTMADLRILAGAIEYYSVDYGQYPRIGSQQATALRPYLVPHIITVVPDKDAWHSPIQFSGDDGSNYTLTSFGSNLQADLPYIIGPTSRFRDDIVVMAGSFLQWPDGTQKDN